jgi:DNA-binding Xre family transcriptional regulator
MIEEKIRGLLQTQNKKVKDLCAYIEMTDAALRKIYARDSCEVSTLLKIAQFFNVSPCYFLDDKYNTAVSAHNDSIAVGGNAHNINSFKAVQEMMGEVAAQRRLTEKAMLQIEKLVGVIDQLSKHN